MPSLYRFLSMSNDSDIEVCSHGCTGFRVLLHAASTECVCTCVCVCVFVFGYTCTHVLVGFVRSLMLSK